MPIAFDKIDTAFPDEDSCVRHLESVRWNGLVISPFSSTSKVYVCGNGRYKCKDSGKYFTVKTDTIFHNSRISLRNWFRAIWLMTVEKRPVTSVEMANALGVTQKTAWYMMRRIRRHYDLKKTFPKQSRQYEKAQLNTPLISSEKLSLSDWLHSFRHD